MAENPKSLCPECAASEAPGETVDRRNFIRVIAEHGVAAAAVGGFLAAAPRAFAGGTPAARLAPQPNAPQNPKTPRPAEEMIRELFTGLTPEQKRTVVLPWNHGLRNGRGIPTRHGMFNSALNNNAIGDNYTRAQQELLQRILRSIASDDDGYAKLTRNGTFDASGSFAACGAHIFGNASEGNAFAWMFTGHHLTVRCDGNSELDTAFGGPIYYGHSPDGYSQRNCFHYQTQAVLSVFDSLTEQQRRTAVVNGTPGEMEPSIRFRPAAEGRPGIAARDLTAEQRRLVETVMRTILNPYRREDADEVMELIRGNGGLERIHLAFYRDNGAADNNRWHFWRLDGPGFVWNYRVLPHVHTYVNIAAARA